MTVPATARRAGPFNGNGVTTSFPFTFKVFAAADLAVVVADDDGIETAPVLNSGYSVTLNGDQDASPGGSVTYPLSGAPLPVGSTLTIAGAIPYDQTLDLPGGGAFSPRAIENALDRTTQQIQQLDEELGRALTLPLSAAGADTQLPVPVANNVIGWDAAAQALVNYAPSDLATVVVAGTSYTDVFDGTGAQVDFPLTANPGSVNALDVAVGGVSQVNGADFTVSGTTLTFTSAPPAGTDNIAVRYVAALPVGTANAQDVAFLQAGTGAAATNAQERMRRQIQADDFATIQQALAQAALVGGADVWLTPGKTYTLTAGLTIPSNCGLVGDGTPKLYAPASVFTNTSLSTKYTATSAVVRAEGGLSSPFTPLENIRLRGFKIESQVSDGRQVDAIAVRNITGFVVEGVEAYGFPVGCGVRASTIRGRSFIVFNHIRDFTTGAVWGTQPQITGIEIDGDRVNSTASQGLVIDFNRIQDLTMTGSALATYGFQTDGINLQGVRPNPTTLCHVGGNIISNVGEGIDNFGTRNVFADNVMRNCYDYGYKFVHGASFNKVSGGNISDVGRAGVSLFGSAISGVGDTERNHFNGLLIESIDPNNRGVSNPACFAIDDNGGTAGKVRTTVVEGGSWSMGGNGEYGLCDTGTGGDNLFTDVAMFTGASTIKRIRVDSGSSVVRLAGSTGYRVDDSPTTLASGGAITPVADRHFVSGTAAIATIDVPARLQQGGTIELIPTAAWTTTTAGNIAIASTAVVGRMMSLTYVAATSKWYPSY